MVHREYIGKDRELRHIEYYAATRVDQKNRVQSWITRDWLNRFLIFFHTIYPPTRPIFWHIQKYMVPHKISRKLPKKALSRPFPKRHEVD